ncbi:MAG: UxaA family hydrolase [Chloroflexota bacterium]
MQVLELRDIGRLADDLDNCAIATTTLLPNTAVSHNNIQFTISHHILEGHRFAIHPIKAGEHLTSWGFPFGTALTDISIGEYVSNDAMLKELGSRNLSFSLPKAPNFTDDIPPFKLKADSLKAAVYSQQLMPTATFMGYKRDGNRGVGTRNFIALLSLTTITSGFVNFLKKQITASLTNPPNIDGIVALTHTEGHSEYANNYGLFLRTMAGFIIHPNVGAVLIVDDGQGNNERLKAYLQANDYPLNSVYHHFLSIHENFNEKLEESKLIIKRWVAQLSQHQRTPQPLSQLKIALQCGGSDAFSGISGNPLASWLAKEVIAQGGAANLAETDELVGAESYVLDNVRDKETAVTFLKVVERFKTWANRHGQSVKANPSGGNLYRGLYNIYLKSLGAATKRHPDVTLQHVIEYSQRMEAPGFYFMDSPGNDLESIAGQVGAGCNLIFFVTGNGSITNFPFVPTIKIVTTSERFKMLEADMDVDAGAYLNGRSMDMVGKDAFQYLLNVVSGQKSSGEQAGHAQVQIWRDWPLKSADGEKEIVNPVNKRQIRIKTTAQDKTLLPFKTLQNRNKYLDLIMPTSLCSGQIAQMCAERLNQVKQTKTVALPHTEGCGSPTIQEFVNIVIGYATHPHIRHCLMVEHGCEKTHNAFWRNQWLEADLDPSAFGWASIQLDGGIEPVINKMDDWFGHQTSSNPISPNKKSQIPIRLGLLSEDAVNHQTAVFAVKLIQQLLAVQGQVVLCANDYLLITKQFTEELGLVSTIPNLHFAEQPTHAGLFIMDRPSNHWVETLTGLGATGVDLMIGLVKRPLPGHPFLPLLQNHTAKAKLDFSTAFTSENLTQLSKLIQQTIDGDYTAVADQYQNHAFQITRGRLGISL